MDRKSISEMKKEAQASFGFVLDFVDEWTFENPAADILWELTKHYDNEETHIPMKYKHLICYAVAAAIHCPYCTPFHQTMAEMSGATQIELQEAALHAFKVSGFSAFMHGRQYPLDKFKGELEQVKENAKKKTMIQT